MLIALLIISVLFIAAGIIIGRYEAKTELKKRREHLESRAWYARRSGNNTNH